MRSRIAKLPVLLSASVLVLLSASLLLMPSMVGASAAGSVASPSQPIGPELAATLRALQPTQQTGVIVILKDQTDVHAIGGTSRAERHTKVILALQQKTHGTQHNLLARLRQRQSTGDVGSYRSLWIFNAIVVTATAAVITELAHQPEVSQIVPDATIAAPPRPTAAVPAGPAAPNISHINAPALWNLGYQGQGIVVASMDTGVDNTHPDLAAQWRGGADSWYDPYGQHATPIDLNGHGTWTMGVMSAGTTAAHPLESRHRRNGSRRRFSTTAAWPRRAPFI